MEGNVNTASVLTGTTHPDVVLPSQYFAPRRKQAPEQRLMIAVLHDALDCLDKYRFATDSHDRRLFDEAKEWFLAHEIGWPYSFEHICGVLDLDSSAVRQRLHMESGAGACSASPEAVATLRGWQLDPMVNNASRKRRARTRQWKSQDNGWDEV